MRKQDIEHIAKHLQEQAETLPGKAGKGLLFMNNSAIVFDRERFTYESEHCKTENIETIVLNCFFSQIYLEYYDGMRKELFEVEYQNFTISKCISVCMIYNTKEVVFRVNNFPQPFKTLDDAILFVDRFSTERGNPFEK